MESGLIILMSLHNIIINEGKSENGKVILFRCGTIRSEGKELGHCFFFGLYWVFLVLVVVWVCFFFTLFWLLYFMALLNLLSPKTIDQDKRNLNCSRHPFTKGSRTQPLPQGRKQEFWAHSHFWHFYPYKTFIFRIIKLFLFKDPKKVAVPTTQPGVQGPYGWGDILEHNNNTKSLSKIVGELELPVAISQ